MRDTSTLTVSDFDASLSADTPPPAMGLPLQALWWDAKGDWTRAHAAVMADETSRDAAWVHAYLHRKEGDAGNAAYWYSRAGRPVSRQSLGEEWTSIAAALLEANRP